MPSAKWRTSGQALTSARDNHSFNVPVDSLADQGCEVVRKVQGGCQIGAGPSDLLQASLGVDRSFLRATDPVE